MAWLINPCGDNGGIHPLVSKDKHVLVKHIFLTQNREKTSTKIGKNIQHDQSGNEYNIYIIYIMCIFMYIYTYMCVHQKLTPSNTRSATSARLMAFMERFTDNQWVLLLIPLLFLSLWSWFWDVLPLGSRCPLGVPSGRHTKRYGKSPFSWVNQLFLWPCSIAGWN